MTIERKDYTVVQTFTRTHYSAKQHSHKGAVRDHTVQPRSHTAVANLAKSAANAVELNGEYSMRRRACMRTSNLKRHVKCLGNGSHL